jgi:hypothetical protein
MASRLRLVDPTPSTDADSAQNPGISGKAAGEGERVGEAKTPQPRQPDVTDLGGGSEVVYIPRFVAREKAWEWFDYLDNAIPWTRPEIRVFGRSAIQVRATFITSQSEVSYPISRMPHRMLPERYLPLCIISYLYVYMFELVN